MWEGQMCRVFLKVTKCPTFLTRGQFLMSDSIKPVILAFSAEVSVPVFLCLKPFLTFMACQICSTPPKPGRPAVLQPPVPVRPYQADKNLCLLPRSSGPWGCGGDRSFLSGFIYSLPSSREDKPRPARWASLRGLSAAPERLQLPACFHLHLHHSYQAHSTTDRADTSKAKDIWGN